MTNKLIIKYNNNKFITIDGLIWFYDIIKNKPIKFYLDFIKQNPQYYEFYVYLYQKYTKKINKSKKLKLVKSGGAISIPVVVFGLTGSLLVSSVIAYFIYKLLTRQKCRSEYPTIGETQVVTLKDIMLQIIPKTWIPNAEQMNQDEFVADLRLKLDLIRIPLDLLMIIGDSVLGFVATGIARVAASIGAIVASSGLGGDTIVNLIFIFKDIVRTIYSITDSLIEFAITTSDPMAMRFLYEIFNIDFRDGAFGVECWINFILEKYGTDNQAFRYICAMFDKLLVKMADLIGSAISTMLPNTAGIAAIIISTILRLAESKAYSVSIYKLMEFYEQVPRDQQMLLERPLLTKVYLDNTIKILENIIVDKLGISDGKKVADTLKNNTAFFSVTVNKMFALMFAILHVLERCSSV